MKTFNSIVALAALAYTAIASRSRASCRFVDEAGEEQGRFTLMQQVDMATGASAGPAILNFNAKNLEPENFYKLQILENEGSQCRDADTIRPLNDLIEVRSSPNGHGGVRGVVNRDLQINTEMFEGHYAALVMDDVPFACCELEVFEPGNPDDGERPPRPDDDERPPRPDDGERPPRPDDNTQNRTRGGSGGRNGGNRRRRP